MKSYHTSVLLNESLELLDIKPEGFYIDGTLGEAGHSLEILKRLSDDGLLISIDRDQSALDYVTNTFPEQLGKGNWKLVKANFSDIPQIAKEEGRNIDGILLDLGMSSRHLEEDDRGFSIHAENEELDMRMDKDLGVKASDLLKVLNERQLMKLFGKYGEEKASRRISKEIKKDNNIETVGDLTRLLKRVVPATYNQSARRVFQALRIAVNDELNSLEQTLDTSYELLNKDGRIIVISFHSLEDRIVKRSFRDMQKKGVGEVIGDLVLPTPNEIEENSRSHSAKLRVFKKI